MAGGRQGRSHGARGLCPGEAFSGWGDGERRARRWRGRAASEERRRASSVGREHGLFSQALFAVPRSRFGESRLLPRHCSRPLYLEAPLPSPSGSLPWFPRDSYPTPGLQHSTTTEVPNSCDILLRGLPLPPALDWKPMRLGPFCSPSPVPRPLSACPRWPWAGGGGFPSLQGLSTHCRSRGREARPCAPLPGGVPAFALRWALSYWVAKL